MPEVNARDLATDIFSGMCHIVQILAPPPALEIPELNDSYSGSDENLEAPVLNTDHPVSSRWLMLNKWSSNPPSGFDPVVSDAQLFPVCSSHNQSIRLYLHLPSHFYHR